MHLCWWLHRARRRARLVMMSKGTNHRASWTAFVLLALGCGGRAENQVGTGVSGAEATSGAPTIAVAGSSAGGSPSVEVGGAVGAGGSPPGVGPIDTTGLPTEFAMDCEAPLSPPRLVLPCKVGTGGPSALECYDSGGGTALTSFITFPALEAMLNQPVEIPSSLFAPASYGAVTVDGARYRGVLHGAAVFSQVDPAARAFVATLIGGRITWTGINDPTLTFTCTIPSTPFWAVAGNFL